MATNASAPASARYERSRDLERGQACSRAGAKLSGIRLTVSYVLLRTYCFARSRPAVTGRRGLASAAPDTMNARILGSELGGEKGGKRKVVRSSCAWASARKPPRLDSPLRLRCSWVRLAGLLCGAAQAAKERNQMSALIELPRARAVVVLKRFLCTSCAYGASSRMAPERCPMCGGTAWHLERRPPAKSPGVWGSPASGRTSSPGRSGKVTWLPSTLAAHGAALSFRLNIVRREGLRFCLSGRLFSRTVRRGSAMSSAPSTPRWSTSSVRRNPPSRAATTRSRSGGEQPFDPWTCPTPNVRTGCRCSSSIFADSRGRASPRVPERRPIEQRERNHRDE